MYKQLRRHKILILLKLHFNKGDIDMGACKEIDTLVDVGECKYCGNELFIDKSAPALSKIELKENKVCDYCQHITSKND